MCIAFALALGACVLSGDDIPPPTIAAIVPPRAGVGTSVTVEGDHFCPVPDQGSDSDPPICDTAGGLIDFGAAAAITTRWTGTAIDAEVPMLSPGSYDVMITVGGRSSNTASFEITP